MPDGAYSFGDFAGDVKAVAAELERQHGAPRPQARYLSWYGLALALEGGRLREGVEFCRQAVPLEFYNPELYLNLGRVLIVAGRKREAYDALRKGIALQPSVRPVLRRIPLASAAEIR